VDAIHEPVIDLHILERVRPAADRLDLVQPRRSAIPIAPLQGITIPIAALQLRSLPRPNPIFSSGPAAAGADSKSRLRRGQYRSARILTQSTCAHRDGKRQPIAGSFAPARAAIPIAPLQEPDPRPSNAVEMELRFMMTLPSLSAANRPGSSWLV
jgi:hypothetical protein